MSQSREEFLHCFDTFVKQEAEKIARQIMKNCPSYEEAEKKLFILGKINHRLNEIERALDGFIYHEVARIVRGSYAFSLK